MTEDKTALVSLEDLKALELGKGEKQRKASLIVMSGGQVGQMFTVDRDIMILGRGSEVDVRLNDNGMSRRHAQIRREPDGSLILQDLGSTNGTYCNGERITAKVLQDGDRLQIGTNIILKLSYQDDVEEEFQKRLFNSATRDSLTGAYNKKYFEERLQNEFAYAARHDVPLSLIMFDIDHFKKVNDTYGHLAGDYVLKNLAALVLQTVRAEDVFARYGGEEFVVLLREISVDAAFIAAERLRRAVKEYKFEFNGQVIPVTISLGLFTLVNNDPPTPQDLVMKADQYLYKAKAGGRNTTECRMFD